MCNCKEKQDLIHPVPFTMSSYGVSKKLNLFRCILPITQLTSFTNVPLNAPQLTSFTNVPLNATDLVY
jgi:hypothetical protein